MIRSVSFSVSKLDKRVNIRIRERVQIQSMTGFVSKWNSLMEWSALDECLIQVSDNIFYGFKTDRHSYPIVST